jgi:hypothetical protein
MYISQPSIAVTNCLKQTTYKDEKLILAYKSRGSIHDCLTPLLTSSQPGNGEREGEREKAGRREERERGGGRQRGWGLGLQYALQGHTPMPNDLTSFSLASHLKGSITSQ